MVLTEDIKDFIDYIARHRKNLRIYPSNNPIYTNTIDSVHSKISSLLDTLGELSLNFKQHDIIFNGDTVHHNKEKLENLPLFFFREGIRQVTFKKGIPKDELEEFMKILSSDTKAEADDSDIATLMWEKDFKFIQYVIDNSFLLEDANFEESAIESIKEGSATNKDILDAYQDACNAEEILSVNSNTFTNEDLNQIIQKRENDPDEKSPKLVSLFLDMLLLVNETVELEETMQIIQSLVSYSVEKENLENVICSIKNIKRAVNDSDYNNEARNSLNDAETFINSQEFIDKLGQAFEIKADINDTLLLELAGLFNMEASSNFINTLGELNNISSRRAFIKIVVALGKKDMPSFIQYLNDNKYLNDKRWYMVRNVVHILRKIKDISALDYIVEAINYDHNKVRIEVISALGEFGSENELDIISKYISDPDDHVRITAIRAIGNIRTADSKRIIRDEITGKDFNNKPLGEKKELLKALNKWKGKDTVDLLIKILGQKSLLNKERNDETRAAAAYFLGLTDIKETPPELLKLRDSRNFALRKNVLNSIKLITKRQNKG